MPLPDNMELQEPQSKEWPLIPADVYQAEITDIEYKTEPNRYKKFPTDPDEKQVMNFEFTIIEEGLHYGRKLWQKMAPIKPYPPKQNGKQTWIYRIASAMAGHAITNAEADKFTSSDINGFIHRQVRVTVSESAPKENGKRYNNIESFLSVKQQLPPFDEKKVPQANKPEPSEQNQSGCGKFKDAGKSLSEENQPTTEQIEASASDISPEINVEDIPF
jgi:hypothetical protein